MTEITEVFEKTKIIDIDCFETIKDEKTFILETGERIGFVRTVIYQDYTGKITSSTKVIQQYNTWQKKNRRKYHDN